MQEENLKKPERRSNTQRSEEMRARLMQAARAIFVEKGYAEASTPEIVKRAEVTRGALYHHFADKAGLFRAVVEAETNDLSDDINKRTAQITKPEQALEEGTRAYFNSMNAPGRCQLLLVDGPAVLGPSEMSVLHEAGGRSSLLDGIRRARPDLPEADAEALAVSLSAAYDRAAFAISEGAAEEPYVRALIALVRTAMTA